MAAFNLFAMLLLPIFLGISSIATPVVKRSPVNGAEDMSARSASTCADPSLTRTVFQGFDAALTAHVLRIHSALVNADTTQSTGGVPAWTFQGPVFNAWPTQQPFTVPLWQLTTPSFSDFVFTAGADATTPPAVSGFNTNSFNTWVYNTQVCGSVPLMSASLAANSDHYYTTDPVEHAELLALGWTDSGVVAFVLPLS